MKKFALGLVCGIAIILITAAAVPGEIKAKLTPVFVKFHLGGKESSISSDGTSILNYKGQLYVPLRSFASEMGASVHYTAPSNGDKAQVDVYYADDRDFTVKDEQGNVRVGHLDVKFAYTQDVPTIRGMLKVDKAIPKDKDVVISILDGDGNVLGTSSSLKPVNSSHGSLAQLKPGSIIRFYTFFPAMETPEKYSLKVEVVKRADWTYDQGSIDSVNTGAGGFNGFPLAPHVDLPYHLGSEFKLGSSTPISASIINLGPKDTVVITKPFSLKVEISNSARKVIRTLATKPFTGEVLWKQGRVTTTVPWDHKDSAGKLVKKGEYWATVLGGEAEGYYKSKPNEIVKFKLEQSMQGTFPFVLE
ncbi:hypothetical protein ACFQZE_07770 [Paenibacillus sp. GCM10027627]|uniref:hypothetical protein n=1 Tax=unclassified Paenibacillus TaxID=185978 RepID=UPI0036290296